ncbi:MAG: hypothetical protein ACREVK_08635 [Gammaproteobacteria bacterium]
MALLYWRLRSVREGQGPAEAAGKQIDEATERAGEAVEDAGDKAKEKTQR